MAAEDAPPGTPTAQLAAEFYEANRKLVEPLIREWTIQKLASLIGKQRAKIRRSSSQQLVFEGMLGFKHLPATIATASGESVPRGEATIGVYRKLEARLRRTTTPALEEVQRAIKLMEPHVAENQRVTWAEVLEREAARMKKR